MWSNFHTHTNFCDGSSSIADIVTEAKDKLITLGISSHAPLPFNCAWCMKEKDLPIYIANIKKQKESSNQLIEVYCGLEVDYIPKLIGPADFDSQLDYTIGSIHFVDTLENGKPWEIDGKHTEFLIGFKEIFNNDIKKTVSRYYELTREMIEKSTPDIIGHLDKIKIQNIGNQLFNEHEAWYQAEVQETLRSIKEAGVIVEVNTRGLYQKKSVTTYPSPWILALMYDLQIPITLNSDAHHPKDLINQFTETAQMLNTIGYSQIKILHEGVWQGFSFNQNGTIL
jgi:histidinol-phosphatase (PHP family)